MIDGPQDSPSPAPAKARTLPFSGWWPLLVGALVGVALRLVYAGKPGMPYAPMESSFIYLVPFAVGAVTVYVAEATRRRTWFYYLWAPVIANTLFVVGTLAIMIEGLICAVIVVPLFAMLGAIGGLVMGALCRATRWRKGAVYSFGALPLLLGALPSQDVDRERVAHIERSIVVEAPAQQLWQHLLNTPDIRPDELGHAWLYRIGVPLPMAGIAQRTPEGLVRKVTMGRSIHFEQVATQWQENRFVHWTYRFAPDSFPAHALDDHVVIGGHYFDLHDTRYTLLPLSDTRTRLTVRMGYRVSTGFNWYADGVAQLLVGNFQDVVLAFYRHRATLPLAEPAITR
jgi:hypothetical protein